MADQTQALPHALAQSGWAEAERRNLAGHAPDRRCERPQLGAATAVLMAKLRGTDARTQPPAILPAGQSGQHRGRDHG